MTSPGLREGPPEKAIDAESLAKVDSFPDFEGREDVFFAAIEMTRMPMTVCNPRLPDNPIIFANRAFVAMTGYARSEIKGRNCRFLQGPGTDPVTIDKIRQAVIDRREITTEILNYRKDGTPFWNALFMGPILDDEGSVRYYFASQLDVTHRHEAELALRRAQKNEAIGQLASGIAHDFNNLLTILLGNVELASLYGDHAVQREEHLTRVREAAKRGGQMIQHLLAFSRQREIEPSACNINEILTTFREMIGYTLGAGITIKTSLTADPATVIVDPTQLELAVLNLMVNARDAMPEVGTISIATSSLEVMPDGKSDLDVPPGRYVQLSIADTGTGMPPEILARVTEPYFTTKEAGKGTGLGLNQVKSFATRLHGHLAIESRVGVGTTVRMYFPLVDLR